MASVVELPKPKEASAQPASGSSLIINSQEIPSSRSLTENRLIASHYPNRPLSVKLNNSSLSAGTPLFVQYRSSEAANIIPAEGQLDGQLITQNVESLDTRVGNTVTSDSSWWQRGREFPNQTQKLNQTNADGFEVFIHELEKQYPEIFRGFLLVVIGGILLLIFGIYLLFLVFKLVLWIILLPLKILFSLFHF